MRVVLSGIGGYGINYVRALLELHAQGKIIFAGAADPTPERCVELPRLKEAGVPIYSALEDFYAAQHADLAALSTPIHLHLSQIVLALGHDSHVLVEKPLCATVQEADAAIRARDRAGRVAAVGYQWSYRPAVLNLKRDILAGRMGAPKRLKTLALWPRGHNYYGRNRWAGALKAGEAWVLDSPVMNATAHYLHNMLYLLGRDLASSAEPARISGELYRANAISNYDTAALRCLTKGGVEVLFYSTHAVVDHYGPVSRYEFEEAEVSYNDESHPGRFSARFKDGTMVDYGSPEEGGFAKIAAVVAAARGEPAHICTLEAARPHVLCVNGLQEAARGGVAFPAAMVKEVEKDGQRFTYAEGLAEAWKDAYARARLPHEAGVPWARAGVEIDLEGYGTFPSQRRSGSG